MIFNQQKNKEEKGAEQEGQNDLQKVTTNPPREEFHIQLVSAGKPVFSAVPVSPVLENHISRWKRVVFQLYQLNPCVHKSVFQNCLTLREVPPLMKYLLQSEEGGGAGSPGSGPSRMSGRDPGRVMQRWSLPASRQHTTS